MADLQRAAMLGAAYRAVVDARYGGKCWALVQLKRSKHLPMMIASAATMLEHNIAPAAWVAWSVDLWRRDTAKTMKPPLTWVFSPARIEKRRGWFSSEGIMEYSGGRVIVGPKRAALVQSYMAMRREIDIAGAWDAPQAIVKKFFPGNTYERELGGVRAEVKKDQEALKARVEAGEILW